MGVVNKKYGKCSSSAVSDKLYIEAENTTNRDNVRCLLILAVMCFLCEILNEIQVFQVAPTVMRIGTACGMVMYLVPVVTLFRPLKLFSKEANITHRKWYKYYILLFTWLGTILTCVMLTHHTPLIMAIPILIMSQYKDTKKLVPLTLIMGTICTFASIYGGYFFGCFDANLLHIAITEENAFDLALRLRLATPTRMVELFTHYVLAREIILIALVILASGSSRRNNKMLDKQAELQNAVEREMYHTNDIQWQIIDGMANLIENRDSSTGEHVKRTGFYVSSVAREMQKTSECAEQLPDKKIEAIIKAAPLHDIGKIVVTDRILQKPGKLTPQEFEEIKQHASEGARVIKNVLGNVEDDEFLTVASDIAGSHHERWDGTGYPNGLSGEDIPLSARIMAVADVFDALVSERVYKKPIDPDEAYKIIESESGKQFDPKVVAAFVRLRPQIMEYLNG